MLIEYDGTDFHGWQYQPDQRTIQGELETAISRVISEAITLNGAGRTDRGVHAAGQVANFLTGSGLDLERVRRAVNRLTGGDIYVKQIDEAPVDFHSRYSAVSKTYQYRIIYEPWPRQMRYCWFVKYNLDIDRIRKGVELLLGEHDFKYFSMLTEKKNTVCRLFELDLTPEPTGCIITIKADRFLHKTARGLIGFLCDIGRGRYCPDDVRRVFEGRIRDIYFAPAQGLCLLKVDY